jgi:hypothetical protein
MKIYVALQNSTKYEFECFLLIFEYVILVQTTTIQKRKHSTINYMAPNQFECIIKKQVQNMVLSQTDNLVIL